MEFLFAFFPIFALFLAVCQMALATTAQVIVGQAANQGARSAIVVLEEDPERYDGAPRRSLSAGVASVENSLASHTQALGLPEIAPGSPREGQQFGARMAVIRLAAYMPLLALAPHPSGMRAAPSVRDSVLPGWLNYLQFSHDYTRAATAVSVVQAPGSPYFAQEPIDRKADVTVRVTYAFHCSVPLVRVFLCRSILDIVALDDDSEEEAPATGSGFSRLGELSGALRRTDAQGASSRVGILRQAELPGALGRSAPEGARFILLTSEVTLPNQGAGYY